MYKRFVTRPVSSDAQRRIHEGENQVRYRLDGRLVWVKESAPGIALVPSSCWYAKHNGKLVKLLRDKAASEAMLLDLRRHTDRVEAGIEAPRLAATDETLATTTGKFFAHKELTTGPARVRIIRRHVQEFITHMGTNGLKSFPDAFSQSKVDEWVASLQGAPATKIGRLVTIENLARWLVSRNHLRVVPKFSRPKLVKVRPKRALNEAELASLFATAPWRRVLFYKISLSTLTRRGALVAVTPRDVDLKSKTITLQAKHSKTGKAQVVPIQDALLPELKTLMAEVQPGEPVFLNSGIRGSVHFWIADLKAAKIEHTTAEGTASPHSLRHTGATMLVKAGVSLLLIQKLGGWSTLKELAETYSHLAPEDARGAVAAVFGKMV